MKKMLLNYNGEILKNPYKHPLNVYHHLALNKITALRNLILEGRPITQAHQADLISAISLID